MSGENPTPIQQLGPPTGGFSVSYFVDLLFKQGASTALIVWSAIQLVPGHLDYLKNQNAQMAAQTEILSGLSKASERVEAMLAGLAAAEHNKPERWDRIESKLDSHGTELRAVGQTVEEIRDAVKQRPQTVKAKP